VIDDFQMPIANWNFGEGLEVKLNTACNGKLQSAIGNCESAIPALAIANRQ
jgi:hypothetical protein